MTEARFITWIAWEIGARWRLNHLAANNMARDAYDEFLRDCRISYGHSAYAWDYDAARTIAEEYVLRFGEVA